MNILKKIGEYVQGRFDSSTCFLAPHPHTARRLRFIASRMDILSVDAPRDSSLGRQTRADVGYLRRLADEMEQAS
jgi:hypothetical protein